jgi:hypothetical protein
VALRLCVENALPLTRYFAPHTVSIMHEMGESMTIRTVILFVFLALTAGSLTGTERRARSQTPCEIDRNMWVMQALAKMESIKPGMTRKQLLTVFTTEGGVSTPLNRTYMSRDCSYFQVDVEFTAVGRPNRDKEGRGTLVEDDRDIIAKISRPYVMASAVD